MVPRDPWASIGCPVYFSVPELWTSSFLERPSQQTNSLDCSLANPLERKEPDFQSAGPIAYKHQCGFLSGVLHASGVGNLVFFLHSVRWFVCSKL